MLISTLCYFSLIRGSSFTDSVMTFCALWTKLFNCKLVSEVGGVIVCFEMLSLYNLSASHTDEYFLFHEDSLSTLESMALFTIISPFGLIITFEEAWGSLYSCDGVSIFNM